VAKEMRICLPTTHRDRLSWQLCSNKEGAARKVLSTVAETKYPGSNFISTFLTISLLLFCLQVQARKSVKGLEWSHFIPLPEESLNTIDDIGQCHFPKKLQSGKFLEALILYMGFLQACHLGMV